MVSHPSVRIVESPDVIPPQEISERTDISLSTIYKLIKSGELGLPVLKIGRQYRVPRAAFDRWLSGDRDDTPTQVSS